MRGRQENNLSFSDALINDRKYEKSFLKQINELINWCELEPLFDGIYDENEGRTSYPPRIMFKALLLGQWYELSDPELEEQIIDRISFRKFLGISISENVPDETTICRFRNKLLKANRSEKLFQLINQQLYRKNILLKKGSIVDASIIESKSKDDPDAGWARRKDTATYGYKIHASVDKERGLIQNLDMTAANVHDTNVLESIIPKGITEVYADKAYDSEERRDYLHRKKIEAKIMYKRVRGQSTLGDAQGYRNKSWSKVRSRVERTFAHLKNIYGYVEVRYIGIKKNLSHAYILASAYNLKRAINYC